MKNEEFDAKVDELINCGDWSIFHDSYALLI